MAMRASRSRTCDATNLLTSTLDEFALGLACVLLPVKDLLSLRPKLPHSFGGLGSAA